MDDKHHPRWVRRTAVSKRGLKGSLNVVVLIFHSVSLGIIVHHFTTMGRDGYTFE
jgi:hypothetical protein